MAQQQTCRHWPGASSEPVATAGNWHESGAVAPLFIFAPGIGWFRNNEMKAARKEINRILEEVPEFIFDFPDMDTIRRRLDAAEDSRRRREAKSAKELVKGLASIDPEALKSINLEDRKRIARLSGTVSSSSTGQEWRIPQSGRNNACQQTVRHSKRQHRYYAHDPSADTEYWDLIGRWPSTYCTVSCFLFRRFRDHITASACRCLNSSLYHSTANSDHSLHST